MSSFRGASPRKKIAANYCRSDPPDLDCLLPRIGCSTQLSTVSRVAPKRDGSRSGDADATLQLSTRRAAPESKEICGAQRFGCPLMAVNGPGNGLARSEI